MLKGLLHNETVPFVVFLRWWWWLYVDVCCCSWVFLMIVVCYTCVGLEVSIDGSFQLLRTNSRLPNDIFDSRGDTFCTQLEERLTG